MTKFTYRRLARKQNFIYQLNVHITCIFSKDQTDRVKHVYVRYPDCITYLHKRQELSVQSIYTTTGYSRGGQPTPRGSRGHTSQVIFECARSDLMPLATTH